MIRPIQLARGFLTVGAWTLVSRVLGFVRDVMTAAFLGAGPVAEAFLIAFSLPNMFRRFFAEGAFNLAFVPMFSKKLEARDSPERFAAESLSGLAAALAALTVAALFAMPWLVIAMASGFASDERLGLAVAFGRVAFPYILLISLAALFSGILNSIGRFAAAAAAPLLLNAAFIAALLLAHALGLDYGWAMACAIPAGGAAQLALVWMAVSRAGLRIRLRMPRLTPDLRKLAAIAAPAALAGGTVQINLLVGRQVASYFEGAVAWLNYADRMYQLPLGVVGIAAGVVLLPDLSRKLQSGDNAGARETFTRTLTLSMALTLPATVALVAIPLPLVSVLFERGAFGAGDAERVAQALAIYAIGLPAFVLQKVLQPLYFSRANTKTPFYYSVAAMAANAALAIGLAPVIGFTAAAWATTVSGWIMAGLLWLGKKPYGLPARPSPGAGKAVAKLLLCSLAMGAAAFAAAGWLHPYLQAGGIRYLALAILIAFAVILYGFLCFLLRAVPRDALSGLFKS